SPVVAVPLRLRTRTLLCCSCRVRAGVARDDRYLQVAGMVRAAVDGVFGPRMVTRVIRQAYATATAVRLNVEANPLAFLHHRRIGPEFYLRLHNLTLLQGLIV